MNAESDDWFDPILGLPADPRDQHPAGKGRRFKPSRPSVEYFPNFDTWLEYGAILGFCSVPCCDIHEGYPVSDREAEALEEGDDPCIIVARLYPLGGATSHERDL